MKLYSKYLAAFLRNTLIFFKVDNPGEISTWMEVPRPHILRQLPKLISCCGSLWHSHNPTTGDWDGLGGAANGDLLYSCTDSGVDVLPFTPHAG